MTTLSVTSTELWLTSTRERKTKSLSTGTLYYDELLAEQLLRVLSVETERLSFLTLHSTLLPPMVKHQTRGVPRRFPNAPDT